MSKIIIIKKNKYRANLQKKNYSFFFLQPYIIFQMYK